ncbi:MAG: hypothetical protein Q7R49_00440, partial [Candidatus Daviesbacteria bacterium]|nr:hypothetical protein [Candidatus Daviesbacteria bacterium]
GDIPPTGKINRNRKIFFWDNELIANPPAQSWVSNNNAFNPIPKEFIRDAALTTNIVWSPDTSLSVLQYITINNVKLTSNPLLDVTNEIKSGENTLQLDYAVRSPWGIPYLGGNVGKATTYLEISYSATDTEETQINEIQRQHDQTIGNGDLPPDNDKVVPDLDPNGNIRKTYTLTSYFWKKEQIFEPPATTDSNDKNAYCSVPVDQIISATLKVDVVWGWFDAGVQLDSVTFNYSNEYIKDIDNVRGPGDATLNVTDVIVQGENTLELDYTILAPYLGGATGEATAYLEIKYKASDVEQTQIKLSTETYYKDRAERSGNSSGWLELFGITEEMADTAKKYLLIGGIIVGAIIIIPPILNIAKTYNAVKG